MKTKYRLILAALLLTLSPLAHAESCIQSQNIVGLLGLDSPTGTLYVAVSGAIGTCACTAFRFSPANTNTDTILAILLSAKETGRRVRIDALDVNDCDSAFRAYVQ